MGWFGRKEKVEQQRADSALLIALLENEKARIAANAEVEKAKASVELRKAELEIENAEALAEARAKERKEKAELREQQRVWAATAREKKAQKERERDAARQPGLTTCRVCADASDVNLTVEEITFHKNGHRAA